MNKEQQRSEFDTFMALVSGPCIDTLRIGMALGHGDIASFIAKLTVECNQ